MSSEEVNEVKNEEVPEVVANEIIETTNEEQPTEQIKEEPKEEPEEEAKPLAKAKATPSQRLVSSATPKKLARTVKVVELVECSACNKKLLPKSLKNTHPHYCKGQPTETLPVNKQKASYGSKVEQKLRKEIEDEMRKKYASNGSLGGSASYETKNEVVTYSEPIEAKTKQRPVRMEQPPPRQPTATELLQQSYNEMKRLRQQEKQEKIDKFKASMF